MKPKGIKGWLAALSMVTLAGCSSAPQQERIDAPQGGTLSGPVVEQRWNLLLVGTDERLSMPETPFFRIGRDGKVSGSDGCNQFTGKVSLGESQRIELANWPPPEWPAPIWKTPSGSPICWIPRIVT